MRGFSKAIIAGNLTRDPELRSTPSGSNVCSFSVAVNRNYRDANGQNQEQVSFINCSAWGKLAEVINQYGRRGTGVLVSGRLEQRSWDDKATGQKRSAVEIVVEDFNFVGSERDGAGAGSDGGSSYSRNTARSNEPVDVVPDDISVDENIELGDIPF